MTAYFNVLGQGQESSYFECQRFSIVWIFPSSTRCFCMFVKIVPKACIPVLILQEVDLIALWQRLRRL